MDIRVTPMERVEQVADLRHALWPDHDRGALRQDLLAMLTNTSGRVLHLSAFDYREALIGFAEVALRLDFVNGCQTSPVAFLEGIFVDPRHRRQGVARALTTAAEAWARGQGCSEFASDALV